MTDRDVRSALAELVPAIDWPDESVDVTTRAVAEIRAGREPVVARPRWLVPVAAAAAAAVIIAAVPVTREAVADLLGIGGVRITYSGEIPPDLDATLDLGEGIPIDDAAGVPRPVGVGAPSAAFAGRPPDGITLVWAPSDALPEVFDSGVGLLLTRFPGSTDDVIAKQASPSGTVELTSVDGAPAWWVAGPHVFLYLDEDGVAHRDTVRLSGSALIWERDGMTYRMESSLTLEEARELATSMMG